MTATFKLATLGTAATLLAGCSWLPTGGGHKAPVAGGAYHSAQGPAASCQIPHPQAPIPFGCNPASVTVGVAGFSQQPQFGPAPTQASYATGGYGSHAAAGGAPYSVADVPFSEFERPRTPWGNGSRLRGTLSLGVSKSVGGDYLDYSSAGNIDPTQGYDPSLYNISDVRSVVPTAQGVERFIASYTAEVESINQPNVSYDDVHSTPLALKAGAEWAVSPRASLFGNVGYTYSEGQSGEAFNVTGAITRTRGEIREDVDDDTVIFTPGDSSTVRNIERIASYDFDYSDRRQLDLEVGGRYYFDYMKDRGLDRVRPFVSAAGGATMLNEQNINISQTQANYQGAFDNSALVPPSEATQGTLYSVVPAQLGGQEATVRLYDEQWIPSGRLNAGVEWQASPRMSLAFETGVEVRGGLRYTDNEITSFDDNGDAFTTVEEGERGDTDIAIPFTVRGSFNF